MPKKSKKSFLYNIIFIIILLIVAIGVYMVYTGAFNYNRISECKKIPEEKFCGLQIIDLALPENLNNDILQQVSQGEGKRVVIPGWKAGRTISTSNVKKNLPEVFNWYKNLEEQIGSIIGEKVYITSDTLPTTCAVLVYEEDDDFINWHYDVNYFNGRFFTLLIPCTITNTCTEYTYYDKDGIKKGIKEELGKSILFEGDKVFHMATKFCNKGQKRVMLSVQFSTNPTISWFNNFFMRIKDIAYIGY